MRGVRIGYLMEHPEYIPQWRSGSLSTGILFLANKRRREEAVVADSLGLLRLLSQ
jgi:hypothetical protein